MGEANRVDAQQAAARQAAIEAAQRAERERRAADAARRAQKAQQEQAAASKKNEGDFRQSLIKFKLQNQPINGQTLSENQARRAADDIASDYRTRTTPEACPINVPCGDPFNDGLSAQEGTAKKIREVTKNQTPEVAALTLKYAQPTIDAIANRLGETAKEEDGDYSDNKARFDNVVTDLAAAANRAHAAPDGKAVVGQIAQSIVKNIDSDDIGRFDEALVKPVANGVGRELSAEVVRQLQAAGRNDQADDILQNVRDDAKISVEEFNQTDGKPLSSTQIQQLAVQHAPILILPQGFEEKTTLLNDVSPSAPFQFNPKIRTEIVPNSLNLPADPVQYIENSELRRNVESAFQPKAPSFLNPLSVSFDPRKNLTGNDEQIGSNIGTNPNKLFGPDALKSTGEDNFLDLDNSQRRNIGSEDAPVFYQFERAKHSADGKLIEPPKLTYHVFYAFNDGPTPAGKGTPVGDHEGDWERITYELDPTTFAPKTVTPSAHEGSSHPEPFPAEGRPKIYVADGSHANYLQPGQHKTEAPNTFDETAVDRNGDNLIDENDGAVVFDTARNLHEVTSQAWYPESGSKGVRWGEIGALENAGKLRDQVKGSPIDQDPNTLLPSGPQGPSYDKDSV